jgi:hypothetical protein
MILDLDEANRRIEMLESEHAKEYRERIRAEEQLHASRTVTQEYASRLEVERIRAEEQLHASRTVTQEYASRLEVERRRVLELEVANGSLLEFARMAFEGVIRRRAA